jgi:hypothetical protein
MKHCIHNFLFLETSLLKPAINLNLSLGFLQTAMLKSPPQLSYGIPFLSNVIEPLSLVSDVFIFSSYFSR